jgi:hypothetical protein
MRGWDFAFVVTGKRLRGRARSRVLGVTSGIFATALVSAAFLDAPERGAGRMSRRLQSLALHLLGRLNGLAPGDSGTWMQRVELPDDLDEMCGFGPESIKELRSRLEDVADLRVEEMGEPRQGRLGFYASSLWQNRSALPRAIVRMRPWSFPLRLRRLTTAAGSALAVLVMTAESWEVAANLSFGAITLLSLITLTATSAYLLKAQRLLTSRQGPLREHRAVSNAGTVIAVAIGMLVTYLGVFAIAWLMASGLFGDALLESWIGPAEKPPPLASLSGLWAHPSSRMVISGTSLRSTTRSENVRLGATEVAILAAHVPPARVAGAASQDEPRLPLFERAFGSASCRATRGSSTWKQV